jgi:hypothetical protein
MDLKAARKRPNRARDSAAPMPGTTVYEGAMSATTGASQRAQEARPASYTKPRSTEVGEAKGWNADRTVSRYPSYCIHLASPQIPAISDVK